MGRIVTFTSVTLDGVMQAPGRPDEDRRGGFEHGGWAQPYQDPVLAAEAGKGMANGDVTILGSGELVRSLMPYGLIDAYVLLIHPLVLGSGQRLFPDEGALAKLRLIEAKPTTTGVIIATYQPTG